MTQVFILCSLKGKEVILTESYDTMRAALGLLDHLPDEEQKKFRASLHAFLLPGFFGVYSENGMSGFPVHQIKIALCVLIGLIRKSKGELQEHFQSHGFSDDCDAFINRLNAAVDRLMELSSNEMIGCEVSMPKGGRMTERSGNTLIELHGSTGI